MAAGISWRFLILELCGTRRYGSTPWSHRVARAKALVLSVAFPVTVCALKLLWNLITHFCEVSFGCWEASRCGKGCHHGPRWQDAGIPTNDACRLGACRCIPQLAMAFKKWVGSHSGKIARKILSRVLWLGATGLPLCKPFSIGYVKGWRRCTALLAALAGIYTLEIPIEELCADFKVGPKHIIDSLDVPLRWIAHG